MRHLLCLLTTLWFAASVAATPHTAVAATHSHSTRYSATADSTAESHMLLEGIAMKGDIYEFSDTLRSHGFKLEKRLRDVDAFLFKGTIAGCTCYFQVSYTPTSRTVYRIMAQPKNINIADYVATLTDIYGPLFDSKPGSYQWMTEGGAVMLMTPDGMDPTLVLIDAKGYATYKEERDAPKIR